MVLFDEKKLDALSDDELRTLEAVTHACGHLIVARTVGTRNGRASVTHGPFAETNEQIG
jgi:hypothetical protein